MTAYFIRRLLLIPPTLVGITLLVFLIMRKAPGGPMEQSMSRLLGGEGKRTRAESGFSLKPAQVLEQEEKYNRDKPLMVAYFEWLGLKPRDLEKTGVEIPVGQKEAIIPVPATVFEAKVTLKDDGSAILEPVKDADLTGWKVRIRTPQEQAERWEKWLQGVPLRSEIGYRAVLYREGYDGLLQGSLGSSSKYQDPVWQMIVNRIPVSIYFGIISLIATYGICVPLGIVKAIKHRTWLDNLTSAAVFAGYAVPGYALGSLMVVFLGAKLGWFPIRGFTGDNFESLTLAGKIKDLYQHTAMPAICYLVGSFALTTMLMKNSLMDNLAADYVRTATAKGVSFPSAVFRHAFRNSLIPIATTFGNNVSLLVAGSMLIERVFDINGFGLLQFNAILERDEPLMMGVLFISSTLLLIGNILSDLCVALVDPRVTFK
ncbi:ABC transporter permease subunit [Luteolibacter ambystomatis]|uniref:ABC transporter permease subunit n=1 Tax=Luteolibacter ambystomatis TaxID=2824561 RepID=A0A975IXT6_9BACT|nr:ABC transporter permease subunit [Luteolibacter ambystomatis]QUE49681.1 ABC transporter permease subunit [Luteolibacter ambystomatis]